MLSGVINQLLGSVMGFMHSIKWLLKNELQRIAIILQTDLELYRDRVDAKGGFCFQSSFRKKGIHFLRDITFKESWIILTVLIQKFNDIVKWEAKETTLFLVIIDLALMMLFLIHYNLCPGINVVNPHNEIVFNERKDTSTIRCYNINEH